MPEGHTIHRNAKAHSKLFAKQTVEVSSPQTRFDGAALVNGRVVERVEAYGKHEFFFFDNDLVMHVHLGLFGKWRQHTVSPPPEPVGQVRARLASANGAADLSGPTACITGDPTLFDQITARLGPDPLRSDANSSAFIDRVAKSRKSIGQLLMDQAVISGVGNVYRAEALFVNHIWPERAGCDLNDAEREALWTTAVRMLKDGVKAGKIITIAKNDPDLPAGAKAADKRTYVYKRDNCLRCGTEISRWDMAGRWCYACRVCQR